GDPFKDRAPRCCPGARRDDNQRGPLSPHFSGAICRTIGKNLIPVLGESVSGRRVRQNTGRACPCSSERGYKTVYENGGAVGRRSKVRCQGRSTGASG